MTGELGELGPLATIEQEHPLSEDVFISNSDLEHYDPEPGCLVHDGTTVIERGLRYDAHYDSPIASHEVRVYKPDAYDEKLGLPVVVMSPPLGTGVNGHNDEVAQEFMRYGLAVVLKGVPRYHGPTLRALTLTQDANEIMAIVNEVERSGVLGNFSELRVYGESQAAMKGLCLLGLQEAYSRPIPDGELIAICYLDAINWRQPHKIALRLGSMFLSGVNYAISASREDLSRKRGTVSVRDIHHHLIVPPVLVGGETGSFLSTLSPSQHFGLSLFGRDHDSKPYKTARIIVSAYENARVNVHHQYGHIDGIMSHEVSSIRSTMAFEARASAGVGALAA